MTGNKRCNTEALSCKSSQYYKLMCVRACALVSACVCVCVCVCGYEDAGAGLVACFYACRLT
jgi:hypothetical protein